MAPPTSSSIYFERKMMFGKILTAESALTSENTLFSVLIKSLIYRDESCDVASITHM